MVPRADAIAAAAAVAAIDKDDGGEEEEEEADAATDGERAATLRLLQVLEAERAAHESARAEAVNRAGGGGDGGGRSDRSSLRVASRIQRTRHPTSFCGDDEREQRDAAAAVFLRAAAAAPFLVDAAHCSWDLTNGGGGGFP